MTTSAPSPRTTDADRVRADAHAARHAAEAARAANHRARYTAADARSLRTGVELLGGLLASPVDMAVHTPENALHNEDGSVSTPLLVEYLRDLAQGYWPHEILENLNQRRQDESVYEPADASAKHMYALADAWATRAEQSPATPMPATVQPALPPVAPPAPVPAAGQAALVAAEEFIKGASAELDPKSTDDRVSHATNGVPKAPPVVGGGPEDTSAMLKRVVPGIPESEVAKIAKHPALAAPPVDDRDTAVMPVVSIADAGPAVREEKQTVGAVGTAFVKSKFGRGQGNG